MFWVSPLAPSEQKRITWMDIRSVKTVFFSPTETTARIVNIVAQGIHPDIISMIDLTLPESRSQNVNQISDQFTIIGTPVYAGRIPPEAANRLRRIKGNNTPAVVVVVYGNREYEDALLELKILSLSWDFGQLLVVRSLGSTRITVKPPRLHREDQTIGIWKRPSDSVS
jgi:hypothetical protein